MRAVSEDAQAATLMGVKVNHTISLTFAVGSGLAAIAAVMYCTAYPMVDPYMGSMLGLNASLLQFWAESELFRALWWEVLQSD